VGCGGTGLLITTDDGATGQAEAIDDSHALTVPRAAHRCTHPRRRVPRAGTAVAHGNTEPAGRSRPAGSGMTVVQRCPVPVPISSRPGAGETGASVGWPGGCSIGRKNPRTEGISAPTRFIFLG